MIGAYVTLKQTIGTMMKIYDSIDNGTIGSEIKDGLNTATNRDIVLYQARGSMVRLLSTFIIEPTIVISKNLREEEIAEKLAEINVDIFTSFYLQVFNTLTNVYNFDVNTAFDLLSSRGNVLRGPNDKFNWGLEEFDETLNILPIKQKTFDYLASVEAMTKDELTKTIYDSAKKGSKDGAKEAQKEIDNKEIIYKPKGIALDNKSISLPTMIQKEIEVTQKVSKGGNTFDITVPILIKATVIYSDFSNIETMISTNNRDKKFANRLDEYRSGMISLKDLVFATDLINEYKANKLKDKDRLIDFMESRATSANMKKVSQRGATGFNKYYGILIVSKNQMTIIEQKLGGSITKPRYREMLMEQTKSLLINVIDTDWERVSINIKDLAGTTDLSYKVINNKKGSNNSSDLADIFKAMSSNKVPSF